MPVTKDNAPPRAPNVAASRRSRGCVQRPERAAMSAAQPAHRETALGIAEAIPHSPARSTAGDTMNYLDRRKARPITDALRATVLEDLPELAGVKDEELRRKSIEAW